MRQGRKSLFNTHPASFFRSNTTFNVSPLREHGSVFIYNIKRLKEDF
jgi:protein associated with RNAse G/E